MDLENLVFLCSGSFRVANSQKKPTRLDVRIPEYDLGVSATGNDTDKKAGYGRRH
jgi:hypothetical protein